MRGITSIRERRIAIENKIIARRGECSNEHCVIAEMTIDSMRWRNRITFKQDAVESDACFHKFYSHTLIKKSLYLTSCIKPPVTSD